MEHNILFKSNQLQQVVPVFDFEPTITVSVNLSKRLLSRDLWLMVSQLFLATCCMYMSRWIDDKMHDHECIWYLCIFGK